MNEHIVDFYTYCKTCKHETKAETESPCCECLADSTNQDSRKPTCWEKKS